MGAQPDCTSVYMHQSKSLMAVDAFQEESIDLIFIDGYHYYMAVYADLFHWWHRLRLGGILAGHDLNVEHPGVLWGLMLFVREMDIREVYLDVDTVFWLR